MLASPLNWIGNDLSPPCQERASFVQKCCNHVIIARERIAVGARSPTVWRSRWVLELLRAFNRSRELGLRALLENAHAEQDATDILQRRRPRRRRTVFPTGKKDSHDVAQPSRLCHGRYFRANRWRAAGSKDSQPKHAIAQSY